MKTKVDYLILALLVLVSGLATKMFRGFEIVLVLFVISIAYLLMQKAVFDRRYLLACGVWFVYILFSYLKYPGDNHFWPFIYFFNLTLVFAIVRYYGVSVFVKFTDVMYFLSAISLFLYSWQLLSLSTILPLWQSFDISEGQFDKPYTHYAHAFFYTIHQFQDASKGFPRNSGFCWEPGAFSCFLVLAVYLQLLRDSYIIKYNKLRYLVFFVALLTTQSATGAMGVMVVFVGYLLNIPSTLKSNYLVTAAAALALLVVFLPSQLDKIDSQLSDNVIEQVYRLDASEYERGLGRFQSVAILVIDFSENYVLGIGADRAASWVSKNNIDVSPTSGIGNMFATYGLFLMLPYFYVLFKSSALIVSLFGCKGRFILVVLVITLGFSFAVLETPIFLTVAFFGYFWKQPKKRSGLVTVHRV